MHPHTFPCPNILIKVQELYRLETDVEMDQRVLRGIGRTRDRSTTIRTVCECDQGADLERMKRTHRR